MGDFIGLAERTFTVDPRPASLNIERFLSTLVLIDIVIQIVLIGFILTDDFVCTEKGKNDEVNAYIELVCGTQIRSDAYLFYTEKIIFLCLFLSIFYFNKIFIRRISRYHVIIMGEKIERYLSTTPVYRNVNYKKRWKFSMWMFTIYKAITVVLLAVIITAAFIFVNLEKEVSELFNFEGVSCGPVMKFVDNINTTAVCHFQHEFLIKVASYVTTSVAILVLIILFFSFFTLLYYYWKFSDQSSRKNHLNESLLSYEVVDDTETPN